MPEADGLKIGSVRVVPFAIYSLVFCIATVASQLLTGAYSSDHSQTGDEAAHIVTSLMLHDYVRAHFGSGFVAFAKDYYAHYPRVGLGHWPPMFEVAQALLFFLGRNIFTSMAFQAVIGGMFAGLPAAIVSKHYGQLAGVGVGLVLFLAPVPLFLADAVMADNFLAVLVFVTALSWQKLYTERTLLWCVVFSVAAAAAILTKGSGIALGLLPLFHAWAKRDARMLRDPKVLACGAAIMLVTAPWYLLTYKLAASGFNYSWGWSFTGLALTRYPPMLWAGIGGPIIAGFLLGTWIAFSKKQQDSSFDLAAYVSAALAMLIAALVIPADITPRYLIPAYPCMVVVAVAGLWALISYMARGTKLGPHAMMASLLVLFAIGIAATFEKPHVESFGAQGIVSSVDAQKSPNPLVLISGSPRFEGAVIEAFALHESAPVHYVVRASKVLSSGNFMGTDYKPRFATAADLEAWLKVNEIGIVALSEEREAMQYSHNAMLRATILEAPTFFQPIARFQYAGILTEVYRLPAAQVIPSHNDSVFSEIQLGRTP